MRLSDRDLLVAIIILVVAAVYAWQVQLDHAAFLAGALWVAYTLGCDRN